MKWKIFLIFIALIVSNIVQAIDEDINDDAIVTDFDEPEVNESPETPPEEEILYVSPTPNARFYFAEHFDDNEQFLKKWVKSAAMKDGIDADIAKYDGEWAIETPQREKLQGDLGLVLKSKAKHAAISSRLSKPFVFNDKPMVVQYEVTLQDGQECGGAYIKLLSAGKETADLKQFQDKTPYTIMFGPDKCGNEHKLHFIFRHKNPKNGTIEEKHCKRPKDRLEEPFKDKLPHLFTLILYPDNTFEIKLDHHTINEGSLLEDFTPSVNPPAEIDDPNDQKPENWDEREKIADPEAFKPDDWDDDAPPQIPDKSAVKPDGWLDDEPDLIPDPKAIKPADWDSEMDGEWEAPLIANPACEGASGCGQWKQPMISNPEYKGKWRPPMIDNPNYKGKWRPRRIPNPDFFEDKNPFRMTSIVAVGIELWSMSKDILFDNIIITDDLVAANQWATETFDLKRRKIDKDAESLWTRMVRFTNDNPWIWVVYVLVIGLPLVLIVFFCCSTSPSQQRENEELRKAAESKKTDSVSNDDVNDHGDANEIVEEIPQAATTKSSLEETESEATPQTNDETVVEAPRKRRPRKD